MNKTIDYLIPPAILGILPVTDLGYIPASNPVTAIGCVGRPSSISFQLYGYYRFRGFALIRFFMDMGSVIISPVLRDADGDGMSDFTECVDYGYDPANNRYRYERRIEDM
jgi:hypothetical protein